MNLDISFLLHRKTMVAIYNFDTVNCFNIILVVHVIAYCIIHSNCINMLP